MTDQLDFKTYALATEAPNRECLSGALRNVREWYRLFEVAQEQVAKYNLDGSLIPLNAKVMCVVHANLYADLKRGYKGIVGSIHTFNGPVDEENWKEHYFSVGTPVDGLGPMWIHRPCWWRFLIVLP